MMSELNKAFGLPESVDPNHEYTYRSGEHGIYSYWYKDNFDNYWLYTNAPKDHEDYDPYAGEALVVPDQPMPYKDSNFFTEFQEKRHLAVPNDAEVVRNEAYDPSDPKNVWLEQYRAPDGVTRFVYRDTDVKENLDLMVQHQLRVTDAGLLKYRQTAAEYFAGEHPKDKILGAILILIEQGFYEPHDLITARVDDLEFIDDAVSLLGRKFICDLSFLDFLTTLPAGRDPAEPLFVLDTVHGKSPIGNRHLYSIFYRLRVSPHYLMYWRASHIFSKIVHRLHAEQVPVEEVVVRANDELARVLSTTSSVRYLVDYKLRDVLIRNYIDSNQSTPEYTPENIERSLIRPGGDSFGVATIFSDLTERLQNELEFSVWLHAEPLHEISEEDEMNLEQDLEQKIKQEQQEEQEDAQGERGAVDADQQEEGEV